MTPPRTKQQNTRLHALVAAYNLKAKIDDAKDLVLRPIIEAVSGQRSSSALTVPQADEVIRTMEGRLAEIQSAPTGPEAPPDPRIVAPVTAATWKALKELFTLCDMLTPERQQAFCKRQTDLPWPQTQAQADAVFEGLKAIAQRVHRPEDLHARIRACRLEEARLDGWKQGWLRDMDERLTRGRAHRVWSAGRVLKLIDIEIAATLAARAAS